MESNIVRSLVWWRGYPGREKSKGEQGFPKLCLLLMIHEVLPGPSAEGSAVVLNHHQFNGNKAWSYSGPGKVVALPHVRPQVPPGQSPRASPGCSQPSPQSLQSSPAPGAAPGAETLTAISVGVGWGSLMSPCPQGHHGVCVTSILAAQGMLGRVQGVSSSMGCVLEQSLLQQSHCEVQDGAP